MYNRHDGPLGPADRLGDKIDQTERRYETADAIFSRLLKPVSAGVIVGIVGATITAPDSLRAATETAAVAIAAVYAIGVLGISQWIRKQNAKIKSMSQELINMVDKEHRNIRNN